MAVKRPSTSGSKSSSISDMFSGERKLKLTVGYHSLEKDMWRATKHGGDKNLRDNIGALQTVAKKNFKHIRHGRVDRKMKMEMLKEVMADAKKQGHNFTGEDRREVLGVIDAMANYHKNKKAYNKERALDRVKKEDNESRLGGNLMDGNPSNRAAAKLAGPASFAGGGGNRGVAGAGSIDSAGGGGFAGGAGNRSVSSGSASSSGKSSRPSLAH